MNNLVVEFLLNSYNTLLPNILQQIGKNVNVIHKRHLPPTFTFTDPIDAGQVFD